jgi:hypothetical protein
VAVAWYTGADNQPGIRLALSGDSATTFDPPIDIARGAVMGRVGVALLMDGSTVVSWVENDRADSGEVLAEIRARRITAEGEVRASVLVAETGTGRPAGFPQLKAVGADLLFAWTDTLGEESRVASARLPETALP